MAVSFYICPDKPWSVAQHGQFEQHAAEADRGGDRGIRVSPHTTLSSSSSSSPRYVWDVYEDSFKMSTYLLAFVVSDFLFRKSEVDSILPQHVYKMDSMNFCRQQKTV